MLITKFIFQVPSIQMHQARLADIIKQALYEKDNSIFEQIDFDNDTIFLEPSLFCYFLSPLDTSKKISLSQSLYGYTNEAKRPPTLNAKSDLFGLINLPNLGYLKTEPLQEISISSLDLSSQLIANEFVTNSQIRLCKHPTDELGLIDNIKFNEPTETTLHRNKPQLLEACAYMQNQLPEFWALIEMVTREFVLFASPNQNSFAGISHHGTAYFNTEGKEQTLPFFIDDISHQCGHIIFNSLTLDTDTYLGVDKEHPLKNFISNKNDHRSVYGAFHGLFTYTCILYSLDQVLNSNCNNLVWHESLGRLGFYLNKFRLDLKNMNSAKILTDEGMHFHTQFNQSYQYMLDEYHKQVSSFNYANQPYTFQYDLFKKANPLK
jgi:hypothetical protein